MSNTALGLDGSKYRDTGTASNDIVREHLYTLESMISDEEKYRNVDQFMPVCRYCKTAQKLDALIRNKVGSGTTSSVAEAITSKNTSGL